jgi:hypothetical protein
MPQYLLIILRILAFIAGLSLVAAAVGSAVKTFVLPRSAPDLIVRLVFQNLRKLFGVIMSPTRTYEQRDAIMAFFAPTGLMVLLPSWLVLITLGYTGMYWAAGTPTWREAFLISGSSLLTLGFATGNHLGLAILEFSEATIGLILVATLIAYLPTIYSAFARREAAVAMLEVRAGSPPSAVEMIERYQRLHGLEHLSDAWDTWELWFTEISESHTSLAALVFYRSPKPQHSWVTAAGAVLDTASLVNAALDIPHDLKADLTIRAGFLALRSIADFFEVRYDHNPRPTDPISVRREEFEAALDHMAERGVPLKPDREAAWHAFSGWRVNYDTVLIALARITMAPRAPWSSDRYPERGKLDLSLINTGRYKPPEDEEHVGR